MTAAKTALDFWMAPVGGAALTFLLSYPKDCTGLLQTPPCTNVLGVPTITLDGAQSTILSVIVGFVFYGVISFVLWVSQDRTPPAPPS